MALKDRISDLEPCSHTRKSFGEEAFNRMREAMYNIEKQIFEHCNIRPEDITDEAVNKETEELKGYSI